MSTPFGTPHNQVVFGTGSAATPAGTATTGNIFGAAKVGAGDANKPPSLGAPQMTLQSQVKPATQGFGATFASPNLGAPSTTAPTFGTTPAWTMGFSTPASGTSGFNIPQPNTTAPPSTMSLSGGLAFGTPVSTSAATTSQPVPLSLQNTQPPPCMQGVLPSSRTPKLNFGTTTTATTPASTVTSNLGGTPTTSATQAAGGIQFGVSKVGTAATAATSSGGGLGTLSFGNPQVVPSGTINFNISAAPSQTTSSIGTNLAGTTPASSAAGGYYLPGAQTQLAQTTLPSLNLAGTTPTTSASATSRFNLGAPASATTFPIANTASTTAATDFNLGGTTTATSTPGFTLAKSIAAPVSTAPPTSTPQTSLGTATNVTSSTVATSQSGGINFCQLEESINKWTLELEEQEKAFVNQATQVNAWDRLLIANGEKIVTLNEEVERVKLEQQQLEHELDYVVGQQRELQDCLVPLEKELGSVSASDPEREYTYRLAENLDTQLKQMSEDLKEIIEHLNEANRSQDSSDPIVQIGKILNAHMNSLQWLDQRTAVLQTKIQQIDQLHQNFRQEHERSFNLAYN